MKNKVLQYTYLPVIPESPKNVSTKSSPDESAESREIWDKFPKKTFWNINAISHSSAHSRRKFRKPAICESAGFTRFLFRKAAQ